MAPLAVAVALIAPRAAFAQRAIAVNVDSVPQGATVRLDTDTAAPIGTTPLRATRIRAGSHTLIFSRDGYLPQQLQVSVRRRAETFTATLVQAGSIYVSADIDGAQIFMDGTGIGVTPGRINNVQPGQHIIEIRQQGMQPHRETVTVGAGTVASVNATLRPPAPTVAPTGIVRVIVTNPNGPNPADLAVTFDGTPLTGSPPSADAAQPGQHIVQVSANGFRTVRREVQVTAGQTTALAIDLDAVVTAPTGGSVRVIVPTAGASVFLDGELLEGTPPHRDNVPPGQHALRVTAPGRQTVTQSISVTAGQTTALEIPELAVVAQVGRMRVTTPTPGAHIFVDGQDVGTSPYTNEQSPAGAHTVVVRADGFDDRSQECTVSLTDACDLTLPLGRTVGRAVLHVELGRPIRAPAILLIDGQEVGEIGAGRDVPNVSATAHELRVRAVGYADYVESVTFTENEMHRTMVVMHRAAGAGPSIAARRSALSTWSGSPLAQRDVAMDIAGAYGPYPIEARFAAGILPYGDFGWDAGVGVRTLGWIWELEVRTRAGIRLANGLFSVGGEVRAFAGTAFGGQNNAGFSARAMFGFHTTAGGDDEESEDPNERSNRPGNFAFTLHLGVDITSDQLTNVRSRNMGDPSMSRIDGNRASMNDISDLCRHDGMPCMEGVMPGSTMSPPRDIYFLNGAQNLVRPLFGATIEVSLSRHVNLFLQFERMFDSGANQRRLFYAITWFGTDPLTYIRAGLTYKF